MFRIVISFLFLLATQSFALDLSKMSAKSAIKVLAPKSDGGLFRWVALLTGAKNAIKGFGFLLGAWLLTPSSRCSAAEQ